MNSIELEDLLSQAGIELRELVNFTHSRGRFTVQALLNEDRQIVETRFTKDWEPLGEGWITLWKGGTDQVDCMCDLCVRKRALKAERKQEFGIIAGELVETIYNNTKGVATE